METLVEKRILRIRGLISAKKKEATKCNLRELNLTPLDQFRLISLINAFPNQRRD